MKSDLRIAAVVVTYNRKELLKECLQALLNQTRPLDEIIVIDNASTDGTEQMVRSEFPQVTYVKLPENIGGAGGFHEGMKLAYEEGYDWIWVMDDDAEPEPTTLDVLLEYIKEADILVPVIVDPLGRKRGGGYWRFGYKPVDLTCCSDAIIPIELFSFVGPLFKREVIDHIGLPRKDFIIWADDLEWALRAKNKGLTVFIVRDAFILHKEKKPRVVRRFGRTSVRISQPAWKYYYGMRNKYLLLNNIPWPIRSIEKLVFLFHVIRWSLGDVLYEPDWWQRIYFRWLGILHGLLGKTGKIVIPKQKGVKNHR